MSSPVAVLISDVHYSLATLYLADKAFRQAIDKASELGVPLIDCGDLTNDKAVLRAECVNKLVDTVSYAYDMSVEVYCIVGNHSLINEKGKEHALNFLRPYCNIVQSPTYVNKIRSYLIPYISDSKELKLLLDGIEKPERLIMHTGVLGANMGHYIKDTSSLPKEEFADFRVISGHYHRRQDIKCGCPRKGAVGLFSYVGNPYTLGFGESDDPEKGFQILHDDGSLEFVPTNLRRHVVLKYNAYTLNAEMQMPRTWALDPNDIYWVKVEGRRTQLSHLNKRILGEWLFGHENFKLDRISLDDPKYEEVDKKLNDSELMDSIIDSTRESEQYQKELKGLWREILEDT